MSVEIDKTTITTFQGDTCEVTFTDLDIGRLIGFEVRDKKNNRPVFDELRSIVDNNGEVTFIITPEMSNKFEVKPLEGVNTYLYGIKDINELTGEENTILLGDNPKFSDKYYIKVYMKKVEGIDEDNG